ARGLYGPRLQHAGRRLMQPTSDVRIRARQATDLPMLARVLTRVHTTDGYPVEGVSDPEAWLKPPGELASWTAEYHRHLIGQITLVQATADGDAAQVWAEATGGNIKNLTIPVRLFVDPDYRALGAGRDL